MAFVHLDKNQKPEQWAQPELVQWAVRDYCENTLGVAYSDLVVALPFWGAGSQFDYSPNGFTGTNVGCSFDGQKLTADAENDRIYISDDDRLDTLANFTMVCSFEYSSLPGTYNYIIGKSYSEYLLYINSSGPYLARSFYTDASGDDANTTKTLTSGTKYNIALTWGVDDLYLRTYCDGTQVNSTALNGSYTNANTENFTLFNRNDLARDLRGSAYTAYLFKVVLNADLIALMDDDPYGMFSPKAYPSYFFASGAAPPATAIMNQFQTTNLGADLFNGTLIT